MDQVLRSQGTTLHISLEDAATTVFGSATFVKVGQVSNIGAPSGTAAKVDTTHLESDAKEFMMGIPDNGDVEVSGNSLDSDAGHDEMDEAKDAQEMRWFKVTRSDGSIRRWRGYVLKFTDFEMGVDAKVPFSSTVAINGAIAKS
jgi:hypothetical protein